MIMKTKKYKRSMTNMFRAVMLLFLVVSIFGCSKNDDGDTDSGPAQNKVTLKSLSPNTPSSLKFDEDVTIVYDYEIAESNGARIWVMPYTNGGISSKYSYTSSPLFTGKGSKTVSISITSGDTTIVDQLKIKIASADGEQTISETFESVDYTFTN